MIKIFKNDNSKYVKFFFVIIISYIVIKLIDNSSSIFDGISSIYKVLSPFILAFIIAYILNPIVNLFNNKFKLSRNLSIALTYIIFVAIIAIGSFVLFPKLYISTLELIEGIPVLSTDVQKRVSDLILHVQSSSNLTSTLPIEKIFDVDVNTVIEKFSTIFTSLFSNILNTAIDFTTSLVNIIFGFLISIYVLIDKNNFLSFTKRCSFTILGYKNGTRVATFINILNQKVGTYIAIKAFDSLIIGIIGFIGLSIIQSKYILLLAVIVAVTNMIPYFGPFIGMLVAFSVNLFSGDLKLAMISLVFLFLLQQFDAWYLDPKLIGNKVGLSPFLVVLSVTIGAFIYGPIGMILASPVASVIRIYILKLLDKYDYRRKMKKDESNTLVKK
ncbi:MAG: AI-2E family transporter [Sarcina sp.]